MTDESWQIIENILLHSCGSDKSHDFHGSQVQIVNGIFPLSPKRKVLNGRGPIKGNVFPSKVAISFNEYTLNYFPSQRQMDTRPLHLVAVSCSVFFWPEGNK